MCKQQICGREPCLSIGNKNFCIFSPHFIKIFRQLAITVVPIHALDKWCLLEIVMQEKYAFQREKDEEKIQKNFIFMFIQQYECRAQCKQEKNTHL
jgi:hypothetical protein